MRHRINTKMLILRLLFVLFTCVSGQKINPEDDVAQLGAGKTGECPTTANAKGLSPVDLVAPEVSLDAVDVVGHNLIHPVTFKVTTASKSHLTLLPEIIGDNLPYISGGPMSNSSSKYRLGMVTFSRESRHWFAGKTFPLEAQLYFYSNESSSFHEALHVENGVVGLAMLFQEDVPPYGEEVFLLNEHGRNSQVDADDPTKLSFYSAVMIPHRIDAFYFYNGSFIDSDCNEAMKWIVDKRVRALSHTHMNALVSQMILLGGEEDEDYLYRERNRIKPLRDRTVYSSKQLKAPPSKYYNLKTKPHNIDHFFLFIMSIIIFFMQCGFAFMEAGAVKSKNTVNILIKNWLDVCIGALVYWCTGYALMYGSKGNSFVSWSYFFGIGLEDYKLSKWFFNFVFAATAATLVSGSLAERCNFVAYIVYSVMITGFIYPIIAHWAWHPIGWLRVNGFHDFAGSGVVHLCGGICALVGCILMGPRKGRFDRSGNLITMPGHSVPLAALGGFILIFGFFACNGAKQGSISHPEDGILVILAIVNTALGTSAAGVATLVFNKTGIVPGTGANYSFLTTMNGSLTGTIALCAGCDVYDQWAAICVGALSGPVFLFAKFCLLKFKIDDPLDAIPVHGAGGVLGIVSVYIFSPNGVLMTWSAEAFMGLAWNIIGLVAIITWTFVTCFLMFFTLKHFDMLRVDPDMEFKGMDLNKHGEAAYPAEAWVELQYGQDHGGGKREHDTIKNLTQKLSTNDHTSDSEDHPSGSNLFRRNGSSGLFGGFIGSSGGLHGFFRKKHFEAKYTGTNGGLAHGLPPNMRSEGGAIYNNPQELFPTISHLFNAVRNVAVITQLNMEEHAHLKAKAELQAAVKNSTSSFSKLHHLTNDHETHHHHHTRYNRRTSAAPATSMNWNKSDDNGIMIRRVEEGSRTSLESAAPPKRNCTLQTLDEVGD